MSQPRDFGAKCLVLDYTGTLKPREDETETPPEKIARIAAGLVDAMKRLDVFGRRRDEDE